MRQTATPTTSAGSADPLAFAVVLAIVFSVYYDALFQGPRADQLIYLYQVADHPSLYKLTIGSMLHNRSVAIGDATLFRPLLYIFLGLQKYLFEYNFMLWQATGLSLHAATVFMLFRHALLIGHPRVLAWSIALWFGFVYGATEQVVWHHLNAYVLFCLLIMIAWSYLWRFLMRSRRGRDMLIAALALSTSAFLYELGALVLAGTGVATAAAGIFGRRWLARHGWQPDALNVLAFGGVLMLGATALYVTWNLVDLFARYGRLTGGGGVAPLSDIVYAITVVMSYFAAALALPLSLELRIGGRIESAGFGFDQQHAAIIVAQCVFVAVFLVSMFLLAYRGYRRSGFMVHALTAVVFVGLYFVFCSIIGVGRGVQRGAVQVVSNNSYYLYMPALFIVLAVAHLTAPGAASLVKRPVARRLPAQVFGMCLLIYAGISIWRIIDLQREMRLYSAPRLELIVRAEQLVKKHGSEPGFSFAVSESCPGNDLLDWFAAHGQGRFRSYSSINVLFPAHYREEQPQVMLHCMAQ